MKEKTMMRRLILFDEWQFEKMQSWLADLAAKGWQLDRMGRVFATFDKREPAELRYRCDGNEGPAAPEGWRIAALRQHTTVFVAVDPSAPELHIDPVEFANSIQIKKFDLIGAILCLLFLILLYWFTFMHGGHFSAYDMLNNSMLLPDMALLIVGLQAFCSLVREFYRLALCAKLRRGIELAVDAPYLAARVARGIAYCIFPACLLILLVLGFARSFGAPYPAIPAGPLPVVRMADILGSTAFTPYNNTDGLESNYYSTDWSTLVPGQKELDERVTVKGLKAKDGSDLVPWLESDRYQALTPGLAAYLAAQIAKDSSSGHDENVPAQLPRMENRDGFDALWAYDAPDASVHEVVAEHGSTVFHVYYRGAQGTGEIIPLIRGKLSGK